MTLPIVITVAAHRDLEAARSYYALIRPELADQLGERVRTALESIGRMPEMKSVLYLDVRRVLLKRFPYAIFYRVEPHRLVVLGVPHQASHPATWP